MKKFTFLFLILFIFPTIISAQSTCNIPRDYCTPDPDCDPNYTFSPGVGGCDALETCCVRQTTPTPAPIPTCDPAFAPVFGTSGPGCVVGVEIPGCWPTTVHRITQDPCPASVPGSCTNVCSVSRPPCPPACAQTYDGTCVIRSHCYSSVPGVCSGGFLWNSVDIGTPLGTPIYATHNGFASTGSDSDGWGNYVTINGNGIQTRYAHLSVIMVGQGEQVNQGKQIGLSGNTGNSTGPHLHYGMMYSRLVTQTLGNCSANSCTFP